MPSQLSCSPPSQRVVNARVTQVTAGGVHERADGPLASVRERQLDHLGLRPDAADAARDRRGHRDGIGAAFEGLGSDEDPSRRALGHVKTIASEEQLCCDERVLQRTQ